MAVVTRLVAARLNAARAPGERPVEVRIESASATTPVTAAVFAGGGVPRDAAAFVLDADCRSLLRPEAPVGLCLRGGPLAEGEALTRRLLAERAALGLAPGLVVEATRAFGEGARRAAATSTASEPGMAGLFVLDGADGLSRVLEGPFHAAAVDRWFLLVGPSISSLAGALGGRVFVPRVGRVLVPDPGLSRDGLTHREWAAAVELYDAVLVLAQARRVLPDAEPDEIGVWILTHGPFRLSQGVADFGVGQGLGFVPELDRL